MLLPVRGPKSRRNARIANCTLVGMRPEDMRSVRMREQCASAYLGLCFHAIPEVNRELSYVSKRMLIRHRVVHAKNLRGRILHEIDGRQFV